MIIRRLEERYDNDYDGGRSGPSLPSGASRFYVDHSKGSSLCEP